MQQTNTDDRWQHIRQIWAAKENQWLYALVGFAAGALLVPFLLTQSDVLGNLFPEAIGILVTVLVIERFYDLRAEREWKEQLILQMGSPDNGFAVEAVRILTQKGWLKDGSLKGAFLRGANLVDAHLSEADIAGGDLVGAKLAGTYWVQANLSNTRLSLADLTNSTLAQTNLAGARLGKVNLKDSNLLHTNLRGANLTEANLAGARFLSSKSFDENTTFPNGKHWTPDTDLTRFTDPNHIDFWRSDDPDSPAYEGAAGGSSRPANT